MGAAGVLYHHVLLVVEDDEHGYLLYKIDLKDLFCSASATVHARPRGHATEMRRLPAPMARFNTLPDVPERIDFALAGGGSTLIGLSNWRRTIVHETASGASSAGPELRDDKPGGTFVVLLGGGHGLLALRRRGGLPGEAPFAEALPAGDDGAGGWLALPDPPPEFCCLMRSMPGCHVTACVAAGPRVWVSAAGRGTYSLEGTSWRQEGGWELPFHGRGLSVPELGAGLCFGLCPRTGRLLACDINQTPPEVRYAWDETTPRWPEGHKVVAASRYPDGSLAYLGDGKFCIAWTIGIGGHRSTVRRAVYLMGVKVKTSGGRLRMKQHKVCFYKMPTNARMAYALHTDLN
uniref:Uncharacterized protein n=1 Tax=Avena sativa TaxID=4498 RepID=A0ACD5WAG2_AVESA